MRNKTGVRITNFNEDIVKIQAGITGAYNDNRYSVHAELDRSYINSVMHSSISWDITEVWWFGSEFTYEAFDRGVFGNAANVVRLDMALSRNLFKRKGTLHLKVFDVFNHNTGARFINVPTYIEEEHIPSLGRYVMIVFDYRSEAFGLGK